MEPALPTPTVDSLSAEISAALSLPPQKVRGAVELLAEGATLPFIARYRKERTGGLDETALRAIEDKLAYFRELHDRKDTILRSIEEQGKLSDELRRKILATKDRKELEDLYLPFRPKRRTRASIARERGLEPLAAYLAAQVDSERFPGRSAGSLRRSREGGARRRGGAPGRLRHPGGDLGGERGAPRVAARSVLGSGHVVSKVRRDWKEKPSKFEMYYDFGSRRDDPVAPLPRRCAGARSRRCSGGDRGRRGGDRARARRAHGHRNPKFAFHAELLETVADCYPRLLLPSIEADSARSS